MNIDGMGFAELWLRFIAEENRKKAIRAALDEVSTEELTKIWDDWAGEGNMFPGDNPVSELDVYVELRNRCIERVYA